MITLILVFVATFLFFSYFKHKLTYWEHKGVPGPKAYFFLGSLLDENRELPTEVEKRYLDTYGKCFGTYFGTKPVFNTSDIDHIKTILTDLKTFPNIATFQFTDKYLKHSLFFKNNNDWKTARSAQTFYYTSRKLRQLFDHFEIVSANFIENIKDMKKRSDDIEIKKISKCYGLDCIAKILFAIDVNSFKEQHTSFVKSALSVSDIKKFESSLITILPEKITKLLRLNLFNIRRMDELGNYLKKMIKERRKSGIKYGDLIELMQDAVDENKVKLSEEEIIGNALLSFFAGVEAVGNGLSSMIYYLSEHKDLQDRLYNEIEQEFSDGITYEKLTQAPYLDAFFNETLRLNLSFLLVSRTCSKDVQLGEYNLEKGTEIKCLLYGAHIQSDNFDDPMNFNPSRFLKENDNENAKKNLIPFGFGQKTCLGMRLAQVEIKYLIVRILQNFVIDKPEKESLKEGGFRGFMVREEIKVKFNNRK